MRKNKNKMKTSKATILLSIWILSIIFAGVMTSVLADDTYTLGLERGTTVLEISEYDESGWEDSVGKEIDPSEWFEGDGEDVGAQGKITVRSASDSEWSTYDMLTELFGVLEEMNSKEEQAFMVMANFTEDNINDEYTNEYDVWMVLIAKWDLTTEEFEEEADNEDLYIPVFIDPSEIKDALDDYNDWASQVNPAMMMLDMDPFPFLNGDEFLWQLLLEGYPIPSPFKDYTEEMVDALDANNTKVKESVIIIEKEGKNDYSLEIEYDGSNGMQSTIEIVDGKGNVVYQITSSDTLTGPLIVLLIILLTSIGLAILIIIRNKRNKRNGSISAQ